MVRFALISTIGACALVLSPVLPAQAYGTPEDIESFSQALLINRYPDIAREVIKAALDRGVQDPAGLLAYSLCDITATEALLTTDATDRIGKLKEAVTAFEDYLKRFPASAKAPEARLKLSEWLRTAGEIVAAQLKKETAADKKETLKNDGLNFFTKGEVLAKARVDELVKAPREQMTDLQQAELRAMRFVVARLPYSKAMLYENRTGVEAQQLLQEAQTLLEEFDIEYPNEILAFDARRIMAQIQIENGNLQGAEEILAYSCDVLADIEPSYLTDLPENEGYRELLCRMFLEKAEFLTKTKKPADWKGALEATERLVKVVPNVIKHRDGKQALVTMAAALAEQAQIPKARETAQKVFDADPSGDAGFRARELLDKFGEGGGSDAASMIKLLAGTVERKDVAGGERIAARILVSAEASRDTETKAETLLQLGGLYFQSGRYIDASVVFRALADTYPGSPRAPEAKFNEAMSCAKQVLADARQAQNYWKDKSRAARNDLIARFPQSKEALDVSWFAAEDAKIEGKLPAAVDLYLKVPATSPRYSQAQYEAGTIAFELASAARLRDKPDEVKQRLQQAEGAFKSSIVAGDRAAKTTINPNELASLREAGFAASLRLVGVYLQKELRNPDEGLKILDQLQAANKDDKKKLGSIWSLRIKTLNLLGRAGEAVEELERQQDIATPETFVMVAAGLDSDALDALRKDEKDPAARESLKRAGDFYRKAVEKAGSGTAKNVDFGKIGLRLLAIGARLSNIPDDNSLMAIDPSVPIAEKAMIEAARKALAMAPPGEEVDIERQRALAFSAAATGNWLDAIAALREVTNRLALFNEAGGLNADVHKANPRLPAVYQDLAVAHIRAAKGEKALYDTATDILVKLILNTTPNSRGYWEARYLHLVSLKEAGAAKGGNYAELDSTLDGLERSAPDADKNQWGIKAKIDEIRALRNKKIVNK
jgi:TolA-binding protein